MSTFSIAGTGISATFRALGGGFRDRGKPVEEWTVPMDVGTDLEWGALYSLFLPRDYVHVHIVPNARPTIDTAQEPPEGASSWEGTLSVGGRPDKLAILVELESEQPRGEGEARKAVATFLVTGTPES